MSVAFVFPGQGSQSIGMLAQLAEVYPVVKSTFEEASDVTKQDYWKMAQQGPESALNETRNTQPIMLAAGVGVWRIFEEQTELQPAVMAGHSLGEYSALVCSGALAFTDAVALVSHRGEYMQQAVPENKGAMAAIIGLDDQAVIAACEQAAQGEVVSAVNFNSPGQVVIAGEKAAVERAGEACKQAGAKRALLLPVSVPSHCSLMDSAAIKLASELKDVHINTPGIDVINNVDVRMEREPNKIIDALTRQLCNPVRWVETINKMAEQDVKLVVESGPGKVLVGLNKRINRDMKAVAVYSPQSLDDALETLNAL